MENYWQLIVSICALIFSIYNYYNIHKINKKGVEINEGELRIKLNDLKNREKYEDISNSVITLVKILKERIDNPWLKVSKIWDMSGDIIKYFYYNNDVNELNLEIINPRFSRIDDKERPRRNVALNEIKEKLIENRDIQLKYDFDVKPDIISDKILEFVDVISHLQVLFHIHFELNLYIDDIERFDIELISDYKNIITTMVEITINKALSVNEITLYRGYTFDNIYNTLSNEMYSHNKLQEKNDELKTINVRLIKFQQNCFQKSIR